MESKSIFCPVTVENVPEITVEDLIKYLGKVIIIDVRSSDEYNGELSHIPGSKLVTIGPDLDELFKKLNKQEELVFVCRSGARSGRATLQGRSLGFSKAVNLQGGMILWNEKKFPVETKK